MAHLLEVRLHDTLVGTITNLDSDYNAFAFEDSYVADSNRPTLSLDFSTPTALSHCLNAFHVLDCSRSLQICYQRATFADISPIKRT